MNGFTKIMLLVWGSFLCGRMVDWLWVYEQLNFNETMLIGFFVVLFLVVVFFLLEEL